MGFDIGGNTIVKDGASGLALNTLVFNAAGQGSANPLPGYVGWKAGTTYYGWPWEIVNGHWGSSMNFGNGVFTCPVAGLYLMGYNGIHTGGYNKPSDGVDTGGYACFSKNGVQTYFVHWKQCNHTIAGYTAWNSGGQSEVFSCQAGDTLTLAVNVNPAPVNAPAAANNLGLYPNYHGAVWCRLVG